MIWTWACSHFVFFICEQTARRNTAKSLEFFGSQWTSISSFFFCLYWGGMNSKKKKTWNSKIDWNNGCENNCHRNMHGQSVHILPVMNSKYMWCIRVTLMAQLCHEKIQTHAHRGREHLAVKQAAENTCCHHNIMSQSYVLEKIVFYHPRSTFVTSSLLSHYTKANKSWTLISLSWSYNFKFMYTKK